MPHRRSRERSDLSFLELVSHGRRAPSDRQVGLLPGQIEQIARTVRRTPEVMVKVALALTKRIREPRQEEPIAFTR